MRRRFITVTQTYADEYYAIGYELPNGKPVLLSGLIFYHRAQAQAMVDHLSHTGIPYRVFVIKK